MTSLRNSRSHQLNDRRGFLAACAASAAVSIAGSEPRADAAPSGEATPSAQRKVPVIDCTDLYHPHQDVGDNFDIVAAYALPQVDLRAIVLDITQGFRDAHGQHPDPKYRDPVGPRDPGFIPVAQLNYIFNRNVPCACSPFTAMKSPNDKMLDVPGFQQAGVELLLSTLESAAAPVDVLSFGSARTIAVAFNRRPDLLRAKVRRIHLCAGASSVDCLEWNVTLDVHAHVRVLRSDMPVAIYPCATKDGPFAYGPNNCFWKLPDLQFLTRISPRLQAYMAYAFARMTRSDFLRMLDEPPPEAMLQDFIGRSHNVWETGVWAQVANLRIVRRADGQHRLVPADQVRPDDKVLLNELRPCTLDVRDDGLFSFQYTDRPTNFLMYDRGDPVENERALREALPELYAGFRVV